MKSHSVALAVIFLALSQASNAQSIASVRCSVQDGIFAIKYLPDSYQGQEHIPNFPVICVLPSGTYRAKVRRPPSSTHACGAEPPVSVWVTRNKSRLVSDTVFGDNCFHGPSLLEFQATEINGRLAAVKLCTLSGHPSYETACRNLDELQINRLGKHPIGQENLGRE